jgi:putative flippase GtrA
MGFPLLRPGRDDDQVNFARDLYRRYQELTGEAIRFLIVGSVAFGVTVGGTNALHSGAGLGPLTSNVIANTVATFVGFAGNRYWTFRHRADSGRPREFILFVILNAVGTAIQLLCIGFTHYVLDFRSTLALNIALLFGIGLGTLFRFWSYRRWVFLARVLPVPADEAPGEEAEPAPHWPAAG